MPRGPPPARSPELPAPGSARQRPRGQCGAGGGLRGGDCLRLAREPKVGHGRPAERWQVSGGGRRPHPAPPAPRGPPGAAAHGRRARWPGGTAGGRRPRRAFVPAGGGAGGARGLGGRPRRSLRDSAEAEIRAGRVPERAACRALLRGRRLRRAGGSGASGSGRGPLVRARCPTAGQPLASRGSGSW